MGRFGTRHQISVEEYQAVHRWLRRKYGRAFLCENPDCKGKSKNYGWALKRSCVYERKRDNFMQMCKSCHSIYDMTEEYLERIRGKTNLSREHYDRISAAMRGIPRTEETKQRLRETWSKITPQFEFRGRSMSRAEWCRETGLSLKTFHTRQQRGWSVERILTTPVKNKS